MYCTRFEYIFLFVFVSAFAGANAASTGSTGSTGDAQINSEFCGISNSVRIVNGEKTKIKEFPWMALLKYRTATGHTYACGGTLINNRYVLTAAHCILDELVGVRLGEHDLKTDPDCEPSSFGKSDCSPKPQDFGIEKKTAHSGYTRQTLQDDIALIRLNGAVNLDTDAVQPICLPAGADLQKKLDGKLLTVTGWGTTELSTGELINGTTGSTLLLKVRVPVMSKVQCSAVKPFAKVLITDKHLCAGGSNRRQDSCTGDSGGPLQTYSTAVDGVPRYVQYGVVSFGVRNCGTPGVPGVYARVSSYMDWIRQNVKP